MVIVTVDNATAAILLSRPVSSHDETLSRVAFFLSRSLAEERIGDEVCDTLEDVLGDRAQPAPPRRVSGGRCARRHSCRDVTVAGIWPRVRASGASESEPDTLPTRACCRKQTA
ncbi:hypothetical protein ACFRK5_25480 [Streptomyces niveus]|uniref:hypothetical protein n=1 Tax=Streptomyces niveus TaxID=193462 RepID=UPI00369E3C41